MRRFSFIIALALALAGLTRPALANCAIIDQLDKLYILQSRLARDPGTGLFQTDIRQIRQISSTLGNRDAIEAVDGNAIMGKGAHVAQFLDDTRSLLQRVSMDDPTSVRPHFTGGRRQNLQQIGGYLTDLRCTDDQIAVAQAEAAADPIRGNSDAEDLEEVAAVIKDVIEEVFRWRTLAIIAVIAAALSIAAPVLRHWLLLRRRRSKRHHTNYNTQYQYQDRLIEGTLLDINCHGTKLHHEGETPLLQGATLDVIIEGDKIHSTVMWSNIHYSGIQFKKAITLSLVDAILAAGAPNQALAETQNGAPKGAV